MHPCGHVHRAPTSITRSSRAPVLSLYDDQCGALAVLHAALCAMLRALRLGPCPRYTLACLQHACLSCITSLCGAPRLVCVSYFLSHCACTGEERRGLTPPSTPYGRNTLPSFRCVSLLFSRAALTRYALMSQQGSTKCASLACGTQQRSSACDPQNAASQYSKPAQAGASPGSARGKSAIMIRKAHCTLQGFSHDPAVFNEIQKAVQNAKVVFVCLDGDHSDAAVRVSMHGHSSSSACTVQKHCTEDSLSFWRPAYNTTRHHIS